MSQSLASSQFGVRPAIDSLASLDPAADKLAYYTDVDAAAVTDFSAAGRALIDDADATAQRTTLGVDTTANIAASANKNYLTDAQLVVVGNTSGTNTGDQTISDATISTTDITTNDVTSTKHGFAPKSPADATKFLNGAATPAYAQVKDSDLSSTDITTNNVVSTKHGFAPKSPGDATQFLNGGATPAFSVPTGELLSVTLLTSASANHTTGASTTHVLLFICGAGGGSGGAQSATSQFSASAGGGAGGVCVKFAAVTASTAYAYTCGAGGAAGSSAGGDGGAGTDSTFVIGGTTYTGKGGNGGGGCVQGTNRLVVIGGNAGAATNEDYEIIGSNGSFGDRVGTSQLMGGAGGSSHFGRGGTMIWRTAGVGNTAGNAGSGYGSGAGGAAANGNGNSIAGTVGQAGCIVVYEYS